MKVLVGLSGGVDSAYAARRLIELGHDVEGCAIKMHEHTDIYMARKCADSLGIKFRVIECTAPFEKIIKNNLVNEYLAARTPNPCIICNAEIKFKYLYEVAMREGFDAIATGHYASVVICGNDGAYSRPYTVGDILGKNERVTLRVGFDEKKDQTYMLYRVGEEVLRKLILPLSNMTKGQVRAAAEAAGIPSAHARDSQEICFLDGENYADYIERVKGKVPHGNFISETGEVLGTHEGIIRYTVGQRKGLGISSTSRIFVTDINPLTNEITLSNTDKLSTTVYVSDLRLLGISEGTEPAEYDLSVKLRYAKASIPAKVIISGNIATLKLATPQRAVTAGQSAVFYKDGILIGGGIIDRSE